MYGHRGESANSCSSREINLGGTIRAWNWSEEDAQELLGVLKRGRASETGGVFTSADRHRETTDHRPLALLKCHVLGQF